MKNNVESGRLMYDYSGRNSLRSIEERNGIQCLGEKPTDEEPIAEVDIATYFNRLRGIGVDQFQALKIVFDCHSIIHDEKVPASKRRATAEAVRAAVEILPKKLIPVRVIQEVSRRR